MVDGVLELLLLKLELLLGCGDVHQRAADLGDVVQHLLVGVVEHLVRVLGRVERLVGLGGDDVVGPLEEAHVCCSLRRTERSLVLRCRGVLGRKARHRYALSVDVRSLGYRTDLMVRRLEGSTHRGPGRIPGHPHPARIPPTGGATSCCSPPRPSPGEAPAWLEAFAAEFPRARMSRWASMSPRSAL